MKRLAVILGIVSFLCLGQIVTAAPYPLQQIGGGTGTNATSSAGQVLVSTGSSTYTPAFLMCSGGCTITSASGSIMVNAASTTAITTTTGNWAGTWQGNSPATFYAASNPSAYISGNQVITIAATGDATGTASGATSITHTLTVTGLQGKALPSLASGTLYYYSGAWHIGNAVDANGNQYVTSTSAGSGVPSTTPWAIGSVTEVSSSGALATAFPVSISNLSAGQVLAVNASGTVVNANPGTGTRFCQSTGTGCTTSSSTDAITGETTGSSGDNGTLVTYGSASAITVSVPNACDSSNFPPGFNFTVMPIGGGTATVNFSTSLVYSANSLGAASLTVPSGTSAKVTCQSVSPFNWFAELRVSSSSGSGFTAGGDLSGSSASQTVIGLEGRSVSSTAPSTGQVLAWNGSTWLPENASSVVSGISTSSAVTAFDFPYWANTTGGLSGTSTLTISGTALTQSNAFSVGGNLNVTGTTALASATLSGSLTILPTSSLLAVNSAGVIIATGTPASNPGTVTTSSAGTANTLPIWTSASALGNSNESQSGSSTFINASTTYLGSNATNTTSSLVWLSTGVGGGYWDATGTLPTISACGTSPTSTGNQWRGRVTVGSVSASSCTITWAVPFQKIPSCIVTEETDSTSSPLSYVPATSTLVVSQAGLTSNVLDYDCVAQGE